MAEWSIWRALEEWRSKKHELNPVFARAGIFSDFETQINRIALDLRRAPPTPPLFSGDEHRDREELGRFRDGFYRHYDETLYKVETLLSHAWVPEAEPIAGEVRMELLQLRGQLRSAAGKVPDFSRLEQLLWHYARLDHPQHPIPSELLAERRRMLIDIAGYPLTVQHAVSEPYNDTVPPLASDDFRQQYAEHLQAYLDTPWLHCQIVTNWFVTLALDAALASKKRDVADEMRLAAMLPNRWPSLSRWASFEHADQVWYLLIACVAIGALFVEWWWLAIPGMVWLALSKGAHRRERKQIELKREQIASRAMLIKKVRDRFKTGHTSLEKLAYQLKQLDERGEYFDDNVYAALKLHHHDA
ncbi:hypothetical protein SAMN02745857_01743 [Andreprevotia lacus DSM 23236]|jgi:hypothetical protein|uniref:Uncharacterized protein n=1 Tax=Andreprevotia lacus DSM 23236 TaxID=1121001 RepID=A0A1W1XJE6_9NEIS|nr:hypothetical protein [Andreprevotia lacus]SMC24085.1 hypothetical protein SAMN02745857_01743 [Andreprevotia lacus DSM 23236]